MLTKFEFTKDWRNPADFPTVETDEAKVRADQQLLHDETKAAIHALVEALSAQTGADNLGAEMDGTMTTIQAILTALLAVKHQHEDLTALEAMVTAFAGMTLATELTDDATKIPTAKAVLDGMVAAGAGDMLRRIYDPQNKGADIYAYAEQKVGEHVEENNPHGITAEMLGLGNVSNTSDVDKPISEATQKALAGKVNATDVIDVAHGGTGAKTVADARNALGLGKTDGALPVANGGTGATTVAAARNALGLGNTSGALPIANGGTGATTAAAARTALAAMALAGGTFTGPVTFHRMILTSQDYGTSLPTSNLSTGRLFFKKV